jgi:thiamine transport system permease protein
MAVGHEPLTIPVRWPPSLAAGMAALAAIAILVCGALLGLLMAAARDPGGAAAAFDTYLLRIARFTVWQALLSTFLSVVPAVFVARALFRHPQFLGRGLILRLFALPLALPAIVAVLGLLALFGRAGLLADLWILSGGRGWFSIYGLPGILVAHVFFNLPLATRLLLAALETVPPEQWRLASQLGFGLRDTFRFIEWPAMRPTLAAAASLVFMLCATSFTIVLTLGGGPAATTLEVAIYQALRFDFDPARAVVLTLVQLALIAAIVALIGLSGFSGGWGNLAPAHVPRRPLAVGRTETVINAAFVSLACLFVAGPMLAIALSGLKADLVRLAADPAVRQATVTSIGLGLAAALISVTLSLALVAARHALEVRRGAARPGLLESLLGTGSSLVLVVPPFVLGAGWFMLLHAHADVFALAPLMVVAVNAVMAMPFAVRALRPAHDAAARRHDRLCAALGIRGLARFRLIDWPVLRRSLATALAFAMALSLGDLGVIALFGSDAVQTLPYLLLLRMGSYRTADAAGLALMLGLLCLLMMALAERLGREAS